MPRLMPRAATTGTVEPALTDLVRAIDGGPSGYDELVRRHPRPAGGFYSKAEVIAAFRRLQSGGEALGPETDFLERSRMKPVRTSSGVAPVTVLTRPHPCPGRCIFCPSDVRMPKSYLSDEPGAQRAAQHRFDPYAQTASRLLALVSIGHPVDKVELIVLGGTWTSYPEPYRLWFVRRCFEALNDFAPGRPVHVPDVGDLPDWSAIAARVDGRRLAASYNQTVRRAAPAAPAASEAADWGDIEDVHRRNEDAAARCVGLSLETRPDHVTPQEVLHLRRLGATKVQIGLQSLSDRVLALNRRGHDVAASRRAMYLLRAAGLKIHAHWMPNLYGSTPKADLEDFARIFDDPAFRPDELKVYPCSLIESAELMQHWQRRLWRPYDRDELLEVLVGCLARTPRYCRLSRVVRDIPGGDIVAGNRETNFRQSAERALAASGRSGRDIRSREIRYRALDAGAVELRESRYETSVGEEVFLEAVTADGRLAGFLRLSLPADAVEIEEISRSAIVREVHVYGRLVRLGRPAGERSQHAGLGTAMMRRAGDLAAAAGFADLAVISAVGTRHYYRNLGFRDGELYQHKTLP